MPNVNVQREARVAGRHVSASARVSPLQQEDLPLQVLPQLLDDEGGMVVALLTVSEVRDDFYPVGTELPKTGVLCQQTN